MGYWNTTKDGSSLQREDTGLVWGDAPADKLEDVLAKINRVFKRDIGRPVTAGELRAGLEFALMRAEDTATYDEIVG